MTRKNYYFALFSFMLLFLFLLSLHKSRRSVYFHEGEKRVVKKSHEIKYVYIDLGANNGDSLENFFGLKEFGGGGNIQNLLPKDLVDLIRQKKWTVHAYEANSLFNHNLSRTKSILERRSHTVYLNNATAAWIYDGQIDFYLDTVSARVNFWGSSLNKNAPDVKLSQQVKVKVACHEIARVLKDYEPEDVIVVKMDIEGAEYDLLIDLFRKNALKLIDFLAIEYHPKLLEHKVPLNFFDYLLAIDGVQKFRWS